MFRRPTNSLNLRAKYMNKSKIFRSCVDFEQSNNFNAAKF